MEKSQLKIAFNSDCVFPQYWLQTCEHLPLSLKMLPQVICGPQHHALCYTFIQHTHMHLQVEVCVFGFLFVDSVRVNAIQSYLFYMWQIASRAAVESALP